MYQPGKLEYKMGYTLAEFDRVLHGNFSNDSSPFGCTDLDSNRWFIHEKDSGFRIEIQAQQDQPRQLALLNLPVLTVRFVPRSEQSEQSIDAFFQRFFQYFHKGGG